jgi:hypothetical protein
MIAFGFLAGCSGPGGSSIDYVAVAKSDTHTGPGKEVFYVETDGYVDLTYTLGGLANSDVYFVLTNTNPYTSRATPIVSSVSAAKAAVRPARANRAAEPPSIVTPARVQAFNAKPPAFSRASARGATFPAPPAPTRSYTPGVDTRDFYDAEGSLVGTSTVRAVTTDGTVTAVFWVENGQWSDIEGTAGKVTPSRIDALAARFLKNGATADDDIYDWVTDIFGPPWGPQSYTNLIVWAPPDNPAEVHVLLYDIDGDKVPGKDGQPAGPRAVGFFYARDNFKKTTGTNTPTDFSNQLVMFSMDSALFADQDGPSWEITDFWPSAVVSTLAHELQHMIHFYRKSVLEMGGGGSETWLNEMASLVTEDLVSSKLHVNGPRGVAYDNPAAGLPDNEAGRLPYFNACDDVGLTDWGGVDLLASYSAAYAFGAYLARNFGGAAFFHDVVWNDHGDYRAIDFALARAGSSDTFGEVLRRWGAAVLMSHDTAPPGAQHRYNNGATWFSDALGYDLGSIDLYNYRFSDGNGGYVAGPRVRLPGEAWHSPSHFAAANLYSYAAGPVTGSQTWRVRMDAGVKLTVVVMW